MVPRRWDRSGRSTFALAAPPFLTVPIHSTMFKRGSRGAAPRNADNGRGPQAPTPPSQPPNFTYFVNEVDFGFGGAHASDMDYLLHPHRINGGDPFHGEEAVYAEKARRRPLDSEHGVLGFSANGNYVFASPSILRAATVPKRMGRVPAKSCASFAQSGIRKVAAQFGCLLGSFPRA
jgi:hypothetical protein